MSFNNNDFEILVDFDFYILLLSLLVELDGSIFILVTTSSVYNNNF